MKSYASREVLSYDKNSLKYLTWVGAVIFKELSLSNAFTWEDPPTYIIPQGTAFEGR
jgi:hypothetical protein